MPVAARTQAPPAPEALHPALWRARAGTATGATVQPSGFAPLDAELPGGGWPQRALTELLLPRPGVGEMRLLAPALAQVLRGGRCLMLFEPPAPVSAEALLQLGLPPAQCIVVRGRAGLPAPAQRQRSADLCWALEQTLRSGQVGAVLAWLGPAAKSDVLRRLQLAAQAHEGPAFVLREVQARQQPSPAPLRLLLGCSGPDELSVQVIKRRGPAQAQPVRLALAPVLSAHARARAQAGLDEPGQVLDGAGAHAERRPPSMANAIPSPAARTSGAGMVLAR
jgi:protein ImuA